MLFAGEESDGERDDMFVRSDGAASASAASSSSSSSSSASAKDNGALGRASRFANNASFGSGADARPALQMRGFLDELIKRLKKVKFLTDDFVMPHERSHYNKEKNLYEGYENECYSKYGGR